MKLKNQSRMKNRKKFVKGDMLLVIITVTSYFSITTILQIHYNLNKSFITDYDSVSQYLITGIQIAIGLTGLISIFYLGKFHDYKREYLKYEVEYLFAVEKTKKKTIPLLKQEDAKFVSEMIMSITSDFDRKRRNYFSYPKRIIALTALTLSTFGGALIIFIISKDIANVAAFAVGLSLLVNGIIYLTFTWRFYESAISKLDKGFETLHGVLSLIKFIDENHDDFKNYFETFKQIIKLMGSKQ